MKYNHILSTTIFSITAIENVRRIVLASSIRNNLTSAFVDINNLGKISQPQETKGLSSSRWSTGMSEGTSHQRQSMIDPLYPGTAVERLQNVHRRVAELAQKSPPVLNGPWDEVRRKILWAGGLRDLPNAVPGQVRR
jgi:hypothetical protein